MDNPDITYFGTTDFRQSTKFGIKQKDRLRHTYIIGKTGVGKSTLLENMIVQDIANGRGCAMLDPHGATADLLLDYIPDHRMDDVVYFAPFDLDFPIAFNVMEDPGKDNRHIVANGVLSVMKKVWPDSFSGRMEYLVQNAILALLEYPDSTVLGLNRILTDPEYRNLVVENLEDPTVKDFWINDYGKWDERYAREAGAAIQNKIGQFSSNPLIRNIVGQPKSTFDIRSLMDNSKILIANLSKGQLGEQNARLLGGLLSTKIYLAAMSRADLSEEGIAKLPAFHLFVDEFQNFANESFADVLSEARKYKLSLTMAHQYLKQLPDEVSDAVLGNVGTMITMRIGPDDAEVFERQLSPVFLAEDFTNLGFAKMYLSLMIDGLGSRPFSANTLGPIARPEVSVRDKVIANSRRLYSRSRDEVESELTQWFSPIPTKKQLEHEEYLAKKKAEIEAKGGAWEDNSKPFSLSSSSRSEEKTPIARRPLGVKTVPKQFEKRMNANNQQSSQKSFEPRTERPPSAPTNQRPPVKSAPVVTTPSQPSPQSPPHSSPKKFEPVVNASPKLTGLLDQLGNTPTTKQFEEPVPPVAIVAPEPVAPIIEKPVPTVQSIETKIGEKPRVFDRQAQPNSKSALQEALAKALGKSNLPKPPEPMPPQPPKPTFSQAEAAIKDESASTTHATPHPHYVRSSAPKEVPEDILRQILE